MFNCSIILKSFRREGVGDVILYHPSPQNGSAKSPRRLELKDPKDIKRNNRHIETSKKHPTKYDNVSFN